MNPQPALNSSAEIEPQKVLRRAEAVYRLAYARQYLGFPPMVKAAWDFLSTACYRQPNTDDAREVAEIAHRTMSVLLALPERDVLELCKPDDGAPIALTSHSVDPKAMARVMPSVTPIGAYIAAQKAAVIARHPTLTAYFEWRAAESARQDEAQHAANRAAWAEAEKKTPGLLLERLRAAGITVALHGGKLTVPAGASIADVDIEALRKYKPQIVALLQAEAEAAKPRVIA